MTIEDHSIIGGLGSAVSEILSEKYPTLQKAWDKYKTVWHLVIN